ncbi:MAG: hypothetical protein QOC68_906 [Solirubrobacteraceae bacterium]|jgi:hypothetical protein|nr:hypothetical protein [Solirubrobacteraceae bacterium]
MRRSLILLAAVAAALVLAACGSSSSPTASTSGSPAKAPATPATTSLMITHIVKGCHTWAVGAGTPVAPSTTLHVAPSTTVVITNNDVMPQVLKSVSAAGAVLTTPAMNRPGAKSTVALPKRPGVYTFTTKPGEDYAKGIKTIGPDNTLKLKVIVA